MAKAETKYVHPLGEKIRKYRTLKGLTQKELGEKCQLNESTIRNYELGNRYPDEVTLHTISDALGIDQNALADPDPTNVFSAMHILFDLEDYFGLSPKLIDGEVHLVQRPVKEGSSLSEKLNYFGMKECLRFWSYIRNVCDNGDLLDEEYEEWKSLYPDYIDEEKQYGYAEDPELENRIKDISAEISAGASDDNLSSKASKRPRKTRLH